MKKQPITLETILNRMDEAYADFSNKFEELNKKLAKISNCAKNAQLDTETRPENVQDPTKWLGKLCWFWDDEYDLKTAGVLEEITTIEEEFHYTKKDTHTVWKNCEPVKPDDGYYLQGRIRCNADVLRVLYTGIKK